jgi:hypothetical protein
MHFPLRLDNGRSPHVYVNQRLQIQFIAPDGERYAARYMLSLFSLRLDNGRSPHVYVNQRLQVQFRAPDDKRYAARNMLSPQ